MWFPEDHDAAGPCLASTWLADLRDMGTVGEPDREWSNRDWFPRAMESPLSNVAII
ncbi:MAG: hypothetical protein V5A28_08920 [Haloarculaceae archaeon]